MMNQFKYLFHILEKKDQKDLVLLYIINFISPLFDLFSFSIILFILNMAMQNDHSPKELGIFSIFMGFISIIKSLFELFRSYKQNCFVQNSTQKLSNKLFYLIQHEDLIHHNEKQPMQALVLIRDDTNNCVSTIISYLSIWTNCIILCGYFIFLIYLAHWLGFLICIGLIFAMLFLFLQYQYQIKTIGEQKRKLIIESNAQISTAYGAFKETKIDHRSYHMLINFDHIGKQLAKIQSEYGFKNQIIAVLLQNSILTFLFFALALILLLKISFTQLIASLVVCVSLIMRMLPMTINTVNGLINIEYSKKSYETVKESLERYKIIKSQEEKERNIRQKNITLNKGIHITNLSFGYTSKRKIFDQVSIDIPVGKTIAIIGPSGAGKTTFLDLLLGLLIPEKGSIYYDDYNLVTKQDKLGQCQVNLGKIISYIPQTVYLNGTSIKNNVAFFEENDKIDENRVIQCLKIAQIWEDIEQMPEGINTVIGENGTLISGGQRQRIALARALYKDFEILIMDEATASLDMDTEEAVIESIRQVKKNKTLLMVTHHRKLANECEIIFKIENKKIIQIR